MSATGRATRNKPARGRSDAPDMFERFPLPLAVLGDDGDVEGNERFRRMWSSHLIRIDQLRDVLAEPARGWRPVQALDGAGGKRPLKARAFRLGEQDVVLLDEAGEAPLRRRIQELEAEVTELKRLSSTDLLTGVWNRAHFDQAAEIERSRSIRQRQPVSLILIDVDHFKRVNDIHGHQVGDAALREIARAIRSTIRSIDGLYRWGGEEFVVVAASTGYRGAGVMANRIRQTIAERRFGAVGTITVSIGVAEHLVAESTKAWFRRLDKALYRAKEAGRNRTFIDARGSSDTWNSESVRTLVRLAWRDEYCCGEATVDQQHRELFELANRTLEASLAPDASREAVTLAVDRLISHIAEHFAYEEEAIAAHGYAGAEEHKRLHQALLRRATVLRAAVVAGRATIGELLDFIVDKVIANHLFTADKAFFPIFEAE
jgi:diguanylate cyclase (GGDEF)-like protein/hemerythrin-like metal-binding protein